MKKQIGYRNIEELRFSNMLSSNYTLRVIAMCYENVLEMRDLYNDAFPELVNCMYILLVQNVVTVQNLLADINDFYGDEQIDNTVYNQMMRLYKELTGTRIVTEVCSKEECLSTLKKLIHDVDLEEKNRGFDYAVLDITMIMSDTRALNHNKIVYH